ncbi:ubiquitin thioesterase OTU1-like [Ptychodera flava]|uniref:ubiquitin thioesterase OTU1-like n=1 Tax=Ptychodera flava TaxID=63121 RepID=UPI00396AA895
MGDRRLYLRCQTKNGRKPIEDLSLNSTVGSLLHKLFELTGIPVESQVIKHGYPPKIIDLSDRNALLQSLPFRSGDNVLVEENLSAGPAKRLPRSVKSPIGGRLRKLSVDADNSCLFTSISLLLEEGDAAPGRAVELRKLIASVVSNDPSTYNAAFLGRDNDEYCAWILSDESWGGAIEISILSKFYGVEIDVVDIQSCSISRFGESDNYPNRLLVLYSGIHYDPLVLETGDPSQPAQTVFPTTDDTVLAKALSLAEEERRQKQYTDLARFRLRCLDCNTGLTGEAEAQYHASKTGHKNFEEVGM